jgi:hypothetical protein
MTGQWVKSSYSGSSSNCLECRVSEGVDVRDTQNRDAGHLSVPGGEWVALLATVAPGARG